MESTRFEIPKGARKYTDALRQVCHAGIESWMPEADDVLLTFPFDVNGDLGEAGIARHRAAFFDLVKEIVDTQLEFDFRKRCLALLGLGAFAVQPLGYRREFVGKNYPSPGRNWEGFRKEPYDRHLLAIASRVLQAKYKEVEKPMNGNSNALGWELVQYSSCLEIATGQTRQRRLIRATHDDLVFWEATSTTTGRPEETVSLIGPGTLSRHSEGEIIRRQPGKSYILRLDLPRPLKRGEEFEFELLSPDAPMV